MDVAVQEQPPSDVQVVSEQQEDEIAENITEKEGNQSEGVSENESNEEEPEDEEDVEDIHENSGSENEHESEEGSVILEREEGDGQESTPNRKVDDDEDKRNPQYIPKRGTFYEHDDRTAVEEDEVKEKVDEKTEKEVGKKKVWSEKEGSRWSHDRYNDNEQAPKSRSELISIYGYDIRNEDGPPRARRRRRYGRGPNKYTRNWEDEQAYNKTIKVPIRTVIRKPKPRGRREEFPALNSHNESSNSLERKVESSGEGEPTTPNKTEVVQNNISHQSRSPVSDGKLKQENGDQQPKSTIVKPPQRDPRPLNASRPSPKKREVNGTPPVNGRIPNRTGKNYRGTGRVTNARGRVPNEQQPRSNEQEGEQSYEYISSQNFTNKNMPDLEKDMSKMNIQDNAGASRGGKAGGRQGSMPPRLQQEQRSSKRYSSLRQRSLPETAAPAYTQHAAYYPPPPGPELVDGNAAQPPTIIQAPPPPYPPAYGQPPPPPPFLQTAFIPGPPPPMQIYPQPQFTPQQFNQQFTPVNPIQPTEMYQTQGGITYFSTQSQQAVPRIQTKRPKAAIPIVPPPVEPRGRGRINSQSNSQSQSEDQSQSTEESVGNASQN